MKYEKAPLKLATGQSHTVELPPRVVCVRMTGLLFETDKAFLLPGAMRGIRGLVDLYDHHPQMEMVITGHTDRVGGASYNLGLAKERASAVGHYLKDEVDDWLAWYGKQPYSQAWGTREDQHMLSAILDSQTGDFFYRGSVHGQLDAPTRDAVRRFQRSRGLTDDGSPGAQTRRSLVTAYMQLDGTTLPAAIAPQQLGCGENHNEVSLGDDVVEPKNRRVEIFLFDGGPIEPPVPAQCPGSDCAYQKWREQAKEVFDFEHDLGELNAFVSRQAPDDQASPVEEARVTVSKAGASRSGLTDETGFVRFASLPAGTYRVFAEKDGRQSSTRDIEVRPGEIAGDDAPAPSGAKSLAGDGDSPSSGVGAKQVTLRIPPDAAVLLVATGENLPPHREGPPLASVRLELQWRDKKGNVLDWTGPYKPHVSKREPGDAADKTQPWRGTLIDNLFTNDTYELTTNAAGYVDKIYPFTVSGGSKVATPDRVVIELTPTISYKKAANLTAYGDALAVDEATLRKRICDLALAEAALWEAAWDAVYAADGANGSGNKPCWPFVHDYFRIILDTGDKTRSEGAPLWINWPNKASQAAVDDWPRQKAEWKRAGSKDPPGEPKKPATAWCGVFATWAVRTAADASLYWVATKGPHRGPPASKTQLGIVRGSSGILPGSIAKFAEKDPANPVQHHGLVVGTEGNYVFNDKTYQLKTVEGNFSEPGATPGAGNEKKDHNARPAVQVWYRNLDSVDFYYRWPKV